MFDDGRVRVLDVDARAAGRDGVVLLQSVADASAQRNARRVTIRGRRDLISIKNESRIPFSKYIYSA